MVLRAMEEMPRISSLASAAGRCIACSRSLAPVSQFDTQQHAAQLVTEEAKGDGHAKNPTSRSKRGSPSLCVPIISANAAPDRVGTSASSLPRKSVMAPWALQISA